MLSGIARLLVLNDRKSTRSPPMSEPLANVGAVRLGHTLTTTALGYRCYNCLPRYGLLALILPLWGWLLPPYPTHMYPFILLTVLVLLL